ncbi:hypothetical protein FOZ62_010357, partial [Perkinsus olseni]
MPYPYVPFPGVRRRSCVRLRSDYDALVNSLRDQCIGERERVPVPFDDSSRKLVYARPFSISACPPFSYCDYTASGRSLTAIEDFITSTVCPTYANTHSVASATARQTMHYREEARNEVRKYFNCTSEDSVIFCGAGATAAINKFVEMMCRSRVFATERSRKGLRRAVLIIDPAAHHSSLLPFRELSLRYPLRRFSRARSVLEPLINWLSGQKTADLEVELVTLPLDPVKGTASIESLENVLRKVTEINRHRHDFAVPVTVLSACSNVTGARLDIPTVSALVHKYNGIAAWDLA